MRNNDVSIIKIENVIIRNNGECNNTVICNNNHTLHFSLQGSWDQPNTHEFTKYIGQSSLAPLLESALKRSWL